MLEEVYKSYRELADMVEWKKYNKNDLFYEYIKHENDKLANNFYAGIVCRFWGYSGKIYSQCNQHVPFEQCYDIVIDTINYVLKKRVWENKESSLYGDFAAPDKAFHIALKRQRSLLLANLTAYKRKTNFNTLSIDQLQEEYNDAAEGLFDIVDSNADLSNSEFQLLNMIKKYDTYNILLLDTVCFTNWRSINTIPTNVKKLQLSNYSYFSKTYNIERDDYIRALLKINNYSTNKLMQDLNGLLAIVKREYFA